jgi:hypothetical protein
MNLSISRRSGAGSVEFDFSTSVKNLWITEKEPVDNLFLNNLLLCIYVEEES